MSGGMGYYDGDQQFQDDVMSFEPGQAPQQSAQQRNPLRDHLKKVEDQNTELQKQLAMLLKENREAKIASELQAKGYDRAVAGLYGGEPEKLDEWLTQVGPLLARTPTDPSGQGAGQQQGAAPASTVPADGQAALQQMQQAGSQAAAPQGTEAEQIAQMRAAQDPATLMQYLQGQGNPYTWNG
jgi:hypothetical protein